jgi:imidazolonepropionase-like amidohydrolase
VSFSKRQWLPVRVFGGDKLIEPGDFIVLVDAGLSPYAALATGTSAVARFLGSNTGSIAAGRDADLLLLDANPLENIGNTRRIHGVMLYGRWYSSRDLNARLQAYRTVGD